jgi:polyisoprenoid-binding protein YceI
MTAPALQTETWTIDASHSLVEFSVKHLMISTVKGRFGEVQGTIVTDPAQPANSRIEATISAAGIDTRSEQRDGHLRSADFFDVEKYPSLTFRGRKIEGDLTGDFTLTGDLTIKDVTREVVLDVTAEGRNRDPWGGERAAFSATTKINRKDFGLTWNQGLETGGVLVGDEVKISIDLQLVKKND